MHRKTTTRREIKRLDSKRARAAEQQALRGDHHRIVHGLGWVNPTRQPPIITEVSNKSRRKKIKEPKVSCPNSPVKKHQWLKDRGIFERSWVWASKDSLEEERSYKMCVHCGEIRVKSKYRSQWYKSSARLLRSA